MATFEGSIFSESLIMSTTICVSVPQTLPEGQDMPVLYLLHGLSDNHSTWLRRTNVDRYAEQAGVAVVMPEVQRSFYTDMAHGLNYFTYVAEELPVICRKMFHFSSRRENTYIAGLSMGGYGALKTAFTYPERFAAAASFSGAVDVRRRLLLSRDLLVNDELTAINDGVIQPKDDLFHLAEELSKRIGADPVLCPKLYLSCGLSDFMHEDNVDFHQHLDKLGIPHRYEEWPGVHEWSFWDVSIQKALAYFLNTNDCK